MVPIEFLRPTANQKAQDRSAPLTININLAALGITEVPPELEQLPSNVIEGEVVEQVPEEDPDE